MIIKDVLANASSKLISLSKTPKLDVEILLEHATNLDRAFFYTHPEQELIHEQIHDFNILLNRRLSGEPIAYILGYKEFWSLNLEVNKNVLIPRPETEILVNSILGKFPANLSIKLADLGTGSGAIALAIAKERPNWEIVATDVKNEALAIAKKNAERYDITSIEFLQSNWCESLVDNNFDVIVSNPPYIAINDSHLKQLQEPLAALVSGVDGLDAIKLILEQAKAKLRPNGWLFLEHGYNQRQIIAHLLGLHGYSAISVQEDMAGLPRLVKACFSDCEPG